MSASHSITVELPEEAFDFISTKLSSGEYTNASDVVRDSLGQMQLRSEESDEQLRADVLPALEEFDADPSGGVTVEQVKAHLAARRESQV
jgi:antitoxin ParD1/3/4